MKTPVPLSLLLIASLVLSGCATKTAAFKPQRAPRVATAREDLPESSRDHWLRRDLEDKAERIFEPNSSR